MLQSIRDMSKSWIFKGLMTLLVVSFAIWGVGDIFRTNPGQREVARVGKISIPVQSLLFRFQLTLPEARQAFGPDLTETQAKQIGVLDRTLDVMMQEASFDQEVKRLGLDLSNTYVLKEIAKMPELRDENGRFDANRWRMALGRGGLTEAYFVAQKKGETLRGLLLRAVVANAQPPRTMIDDLYMARGAKRVFEVVTLRNESQTDIKKPSEDELKSYYEEHEDAFVAPEYRGLTIAKLDSDSVAKDVSISDEEIAKAYETRADELRKPELRDLVQIVFQDEEKAKAFSDSVKTSSSFADAAKAKGLTPVAMGAMDEKTILPELYTSVFSLEEGETSGPIKTDLGWHVVQVKKIRGGGVPPLAQIKEELRKQLQNERAGDVIARQINQIDDSIAGGQSLEDIADTLKLRLLRYASLDAAGNGPDGKPVNDLPMKTEILQTAFTLNPGEASQVFDDGQGHYFVVRADQIAPSHTLPFEEVRAKVLAGWTALRQDEAAAKAAEETASDMRAGKAATSFAARPGVEVRLSKPISQLGDTDADLPPEALSQALRLQKGDVITAAKPGKHYVLKLVDIVPVSAKKPDASRLKVQDDLQDRLRIDILEQYANSLRKDFPWKINTELLNSLKN